MKKLSLYIIMGLILISCGGDNGGGDDNPDGEENQVKEIAGFRYVDLGLPSGLKWAVHNMGAATSTEYGDYYAWGEIQTKEEFNYNECPINGVEIDDISGNPEYDAYWTSTPGSDRYGAHALAFDENSTRAGWGNGRYIGRTIRPVSN